MIAENQRSLSSIKLHKINRFWPAYVHIAEIVYCINRNKIFLPQNRCKKVVSTQKLLTKDELKKIYHQIRIKFIGRRNGTNFNPKSFQHLSTLWFSANNFFFPVSKCLTTKICKYFYLDNRTNSNSNFYVCINGN